MWKWLKELLKSEWDEPEFDSACTLTLGSGRKFRGAIYKQHNHVTGKNRYYVRGAYPDYVLIDSDAYEKQEIMVFLGEHLTDKYDNKGEVTYDDTLGVWCFDQHGTTLFDGDMNIRSFEVIGNIFENPELL